MDYVALCGHSDVLEFLCYNQLSYEVEQLVKSGYKHFTMGTHGNFDRIVLNICKKIRKTYTDISILVVITSFNDIKKHVIMDDYGIDSYTPYDDVETVMYDIEEVYYKRRITESNKKMIDNSTILLCYVDENRKYSGAKNTMLYAKKKNKKIINIFK